MRPAAVTVSALSGGTGSRLSSAQNAAAANAADHGCAPAQARPPATARASSMAAQAPVSSREGTRTAVTPSPASGRRTAGARVSDGASGVFDAEPGGVLDRVLDRVRDGVLEGALDGALDGVLDGVLVGDVACMAGGLGDS
jgi:hypothetical protein